MAAPTLDVHIGEWTPSRWDEIDTIRAEHNPRAFGDRARPGITSELIDWAALGFTPRWVGEDSSEAVAALEPNLFHDRGADEWRRFLAGAESRAELALAVSLVGSAAEPAYRPLGGLRAGVTLPGGDGSSVGGERLALASPPEPAPDLGRADRDLALRLAGARPSELPWWHLELAGFEEYRGGYIAESGPEGTLLPLLVSRAGEVVAAVWTSPDNAIRHYVLPYLPSYVPILQWLSEQAIPEFVPTAARRMRTSLAGEAALQTGAEVAALAELADLEADYDRRRNELQARVDSAAAEANEVRDPLLYGSGGSLVAAVHRVLTDAGVAIRDLDELLGTTANADLLASWRDRNILIEVKSATGNAPERLAEAPSRHLATWPQLRPQIPVEGVVLVVNHQSKTHPLDRSPQPYSRTEFIDSLAFPVISAMQLFGWWRRGDHEAIRSAFFGT
jgi:hypothetical protein